MGRVMAAARSPGQHLRHDGGLLDHRQRRCARNELYTIIEDEDGPSRPRICAVNASDVEIAGAFQLPHSAYWLLYVTQVLATTAGVEFQPDHLLLRSRDEAKHWVDLLGHLYAKAA